MFYLLFACEILERVVLCEPNLTKPDQILFASHPQSSPLVSTNWMSREHCNISFQNTWLILYKRCIVKQKRKQERSIKTKSLKHHITLYFCQKICYLGLTIKQMSNTNLILQAHLYCIFILRLNNYLSTLQRYCIALLICNRCL